MAGPTFKGYMDNLQVKTGKTAEDFWKLASKKGFVKRGKVVSKHSEMLAWLKSKDIGLDTCTQTSSYYIYDSAPMTPKLSIQSKKWAHSTGYKDHEK